MYAGPATEVSRHVGYFGGWSGTDVDGGKDHDRPGRHLLPQHAVVVVVHRRVGGLLSDEIAPQSRADDVAVAGLEPQAHLEAFDEAAIDCLEPDGVHADAPRTDRGVSPLPDRKRVAQRR